MSRVSRSDAGPDSGQAVAGIAGRSARVTGTQGPVGNTRHSGTASYPSYSPAASPAPGVPSAPGGAAGPGASATQGAASFPAAPEHGGRPVSRSAVSHAGGYGIGPDGRTGASVPGHSAGHPGSGHQSGHAGAESGFAAFAAGPAAPFSGPGTPGTGIGPAVPGMSVPGLAGPGGVNGLPAGPLGLGVPGHGLTGHGPAGHGPGGHGGSAAGLNGASTPVMAAAPRKLSGRRRRETVAVLIFGGAPIFESSIPLSVFGVDRQDAGVPRYRLLVCAGEDGPLATTGGLTLSAPYGLEALARAGTIVVPAWRSISQPPPVEAITALRKAHHEGARIIGLCTGAFVLAAAGLLDGRPATTHWMYAPTLAKRYPRVHVDPRELFVDDGDVLTSAGTAAGIDLCLHVVRSDHGAEAANALARRLVVPSRRSGGGQAQYIDQSLPEEIGNDPLAEVVTWALENLNQQFDVEVLAARAYMSRRTFDRRFRTLTGSAPLQWLITQRVLQAQRLLETSELSVDDVARRCGFRSPVALRGHFRRQLGVSPAAYRTGYRARRPGAAAPLSASAPGGDLRPAGVAPTPAAAGVAGGVPGQHGPHGGHGGHTALGVLGAHGSASAPGFPGGAGGAHPGQHGQPSGQGVHARAGQPYPHQAAGHQSHPGQPGSGRGPVRPPMVPAQPGPGAGRPPRTAEHAAAEDGLPQPGARGQGQGHRSAADRSSDEAVPGGSAGRVHGAAGGRLPAVAPGPSAEARARQARAAGQVRPPAARTAAPDARESREARPGRDVRPAHPAAHPGRDGREPDGHDQDEHGAEAPRPAPSVPVGRDRAVG